MAKKAAQAKNPAAVALGRLGGERRVPKGFATLTETERSDAAVRGIKARWAKYYQEHPEKLKAKLEKTDEQGKPPLTVKEMAAMGGKARAEGMSKKRRKEIAKSEAEARWGKEKKDPK